MNDLTSLSLTETIRALKEKKTSTKEIHTQYLDRIEKLNPKINAFLSLNEKSDKIPAAIKDLISVKGLPMTCGSKILEGYIPPYNATVIERLMANGVSVIGKTNLDEFAMGSSGENSAYGPTKNPWNLKKVPGGSSSGSAAAVAADFCAFALGTDSGGSIRQPASFCGVVGLKPSYGKVPRYGAQSMASSLDQIGPITKTVEDARLVFSWIQGADGKDNNAVTNGKWQMANGKAQESKKISNPKPLAISSKPSQRLFIHLTNHNRNTLETLRTFFSSTHGSTPVFIVLDQNGQKRTVETSFHVEPDAAVIASIESIVGAGAVKVV